MGRDCSVCYEIKGNWQKFPIKEYRKFVKTKSNVILSTKYFKIVPSLGALNKSHILIVPKLHLKSLSRINKNSINELINLQKTLKQYYFESTGKNLIFFEHGAGDRSESSGTCVEHAHLHVIGGINSFKEKIMKNLPFKKIDNLSLLHKYADNHFGYLLFENSQGVWINNNPMVTPQYFRRTYASLQKYPDIWDWSTNPNINIIKKVIEVYRGLRKTINN